MLWVIHDVSICFVFFCLWRRIYFINIIIIVINKLPETFAPTYNGEEMPTCYRQSLCYVQGSGQLSHDYKDGKITPTTRHTHAHKTPDVREKQGER